MESPIRSKPGIGVVIFFAVFIVGALLIEAWSAYQLEGWRGLVPFGGTILLGAVAGSALEVLAAAVDRRGPVGMAVRFALAIGLLTIVFVGLGLIWDEASPPTFASPVLAGFGLTRLALWTWRRRSEGRTPKETPVEADDAQMWSGTAFPP